jgi:hypothetical protein
MNRAEPAAVEAVQMMRAIHSTAREARSCET